MTGGWSPPEFTVEGRFLRFPLLTYPSPLLPPSRLDAVLETHAFFAGPIRCDCQRPPDGRGDAQLAFCALPAVLSLLLQIRRDVQQYVNPPFLVFAADGRGTGYHVFSITPGLDSVAHSYPRLAFTQVCGIPGADFGCIAVPPIIVASFANQESGCNPATIGGGGEQGMMQITPDKCVGAPGGNCLDVVSEQLDFINARIESDELGMGRTLTSIRPLRILRIS